MRQRTLEMTEREFERWWPEHPDLHAEFVDGRVILMTPDSPREGSISDFLSRILNLIVETDNSGEVYGNVYTRLRPGLWRAPDVFLLKLEHTDRVQETCVEGIPDLAIEVVSRDSKKRDWTDKRLEYQAMGIPEYWIVDQRKNTVALYKLNDKGEYELVPPVDGVLRSTVEPRFWIRESWLWQKPLPRTLDVIRELGLID